MGKRYYLAYGSNLNVRQMRWRCPTAKIIGTAVIPDYELLFKGSKTGAYLTIEPKAGSSVPVAVWDVTAEDEAALDRFEGFPSFYYKKELKLPVMGFLSGKVRKRNAFVYIMHEDRLPGIPTREYLATCAEGYGFFGFDQDILYTAYANSIEEGVFWTRKMK